MFSIGATILDLLTHPRFSLFWSALPAELHSRYLALGVWASSSFAC